MDGFRLVETLSVVQLISSTGASCPHSFSDLFRGLAVSPSLSEIHRICAVFFIFVFKQDFQTVAFSRDLSTLSVIL